jgi:murein DD-endopeptidase MepM/ murein hydrolase activator NlpD
VVRRLFVVVIVMGLIQFGATAPVPRPAGAAPVVATRWVRPVDGPVVRPFVAPVSVYGAGHRGADLSVPLATPVHAAGAGRVVFAGAVAGSLHVVVLHPGGLRTSYSYLSAVSVHEGDDVTAGAIVGLSGTDPDDAGPALHFALRVGDTYVDPMVLFRAPDLTRLVHLAPDDGPDLEPLLPPGSAREAAGLADGLGRAADTEAAAPGPGIGLPDVLPGVGTVLDVLGTVARAAATLPPAVGAPLRAFVVDAAQRLATAPLASAAVAIQLRSVVEDLGRWAASRLHCTLHPHAADGSGGDGNLVLVAAGITSERPGAAPPLDLPLDRLGFRPADVTYFSYRPGSVTYTEADSFRDLDAEAVNLGVQLRALAAAHPGRRVDLLAHSQGGLVVLAFLASVYDPGDPAYPPLGAVVTFASPLSGAPAAGAALELASGAAGRGGRAGRRAGARARRGRARPGRARRPPRPLRRAAGRRHLDRPARARIRVPARVAGPGSPRRGAVHLHRGGRRPGGARALHPVPRDDPGAGRPGRRHRHGAHRDRPRRRRPRRGPGRPAGG